MLFPFSTHLILFIAPLFYGIGIGKRYVNPVYREIKLLITSDFQETVIMNGTQLFLKKKYLEMSCKYHNFTFYSTTFNDFVEKKPHLCMSHTLIYVDDFLVKHGRIFNHYESEMLHRIPDTSNAIVLNADNILQTPFKDYDIIRLFRIVDFQIKNDK